MREREEGEQIPLPLPFEEGAIRTSRKNRPRNVPMRKTPVPILGEKERGMLEAWWRAEVEVVLQEDFQNWRNTDFSGSDMDRAQSEETLRSRLASSSGLPFTVENIASRALNTFLRLEYQSFPKTETRRYLAEEFVEMLASARDLNTRRKQGLKDIVSPQLPGFN